MKRMDVKNNVEYTQEKEEKWTMIYPLLLVGICYAVGAYLVYQL